MPKKRARKHKARANRPANASSKKRKVMVSEESLKRVEFHRQAIALLPHPDDPGAGTAFMVPGTHSMQRFCTCNASESRTCEHLRELEKVYQTLEKKLGGESPEAVFRASVWFQLAGILAEGLRDTPQQIDWQNRQENGCNVQIASSSHGEVLLTYFSDGADAIRLRERCGRISSEATGLCHRGAALDALSRLTLTANERLLLEQGMKTRGQALQASFWYRLTYHAYREFGGSGCQFCPHIDEASGAFSITCGPTGDPSRLCLHIPRENVRRILKTLEGAIPADCKLKIHAQRLKSVIQVTPVADRSLEIQPFLQLNLSGNGVKRYPMKDLEKFRYGNLFYLKDKGLLAEREPPSEDVEQLESAGWQRVTGDAVPRFLEDLKHLGKSDDYLLDPAIQKLKIFKQAEQTQVTSQAAEHDWYWISVQYGFGTANLSLEEILRARREGTRFIETAEGWVDCASEELERLDALETLSSSPSLKKGFNRRRFSSMDLLRLQAASGPSLQVVGEDTGGRRIEQIFAMQPSSALPQLDGMTSALRDYQKRGVEWIRFLYENGFGGLLCDDMGLGKTHQVMGFLVYLREHEGILDPCVVVCPTTVLSHWSNKIREHAPGLKAVIYHGGQRNLKEALADHDVLLTSYGILRKDIRQLVQHTFALAVFDEIQYIKNPETLASAAANRIRARMKLGLTGTPIENSLIELKALLDLTVPGYLGTDDAFMTRYVAPIEQDLKSPRRKELTRLIAPFTLRRLKKTVLSELPQKIEDIRTCRLSEDQVKLYRDAIAARGGRLLELLHRKKNPIPYIHVFALLTLLKQICNHPALLRDPSADYTSLQSGKWDLFQEIFKESIDSGQKIVIYSQFLGMIRIIADFLEKQSVGHVTLTGSSRNRGDIISRFNNDPDCRVYVGSLKAGGAGIDLVAASVVIHYDRWWNAAREDQATDRVHRIGQKRGVQVFKLVTEGTLEEKISAIIQRKRYLMDSVVKEDDPGILKTFTREQLIELLSTSEL